MTTPVRDLVGVLNWLGWNRQHWTDPAAVQGLFCLVVSRWPNTESSPWLPAWVWWLGIAAIKRWGSTTLKASVHEVVCFLSVISCSMEHIYSKKMRVSANEMLHFLSITGCSMEHLWKKAVATKTQTMENILWNYGKCTVKLWELWEIYCELPLRFCGLYYEQVLPHA